jgi:SAM-dependent methyltransferase
MVTKTRSLGKVNVFDKYVDGKYAEFYVNPAKKAYVDYARSIVEKISKNSIILDIGAGPGSLAKEISNITDKLIFVDGVEPSNTHNDGVKLAKELIDSKSNVHYSAYQGYCSDVELLRPVKQIYDVISSARSFHHWKDEFGGKQGGFNRILDLSNKYLKSGGFVSILDPRFNDFVTSNPHKYKSEVTLARKILEKFIGHSDSPDYFISPTELIPSMISKGFKLNSYQTYPKMDVHEEMKKHKGFENLQTPLCEIYVCQFQKVY